MNKLLYNLLLLKCRQSALGNKLTKLFDPAEPLNPSNPGHDKQGFGVKAHRHGQVGEMSAVVVFLSSLFAQSDGRYDTLSTFRYLSRWNSS